MPFQTCTADPDTRLLNCVVDKDVDLYGLSLDEWINIGLMCGPKTIQKLGDLLHVDILTRWYIGNRVYNRVFHL